MLTTRQRSLETAFGLAVRAARLAMGTSQEQLAHDSGLHRTFISQVERGIKSPSLNSMQRIASALSTPLDELVRAAVTVLNSPRKAGARTRDSA